jgi:hypothetical protein
MNSADKEDPRKSKRFPFRQEIIIDGSRRCTCMDISEGGLFVSAIQYFEEKSIVDMSVPFNGEKIRLKGQVQFYQPGIGIGINFIELSDEQRAKIRELITSLAENLHESTPI